MPPLSLIILKTEFKIHYSNSPKYFLLEKQRDSLLNAFSIELMNNIAQLPVVFGV